MATLGLNHYNLRADHALMEKLRDFYCDIVGLAVGFRPPFGSHGYWLYAGEQPVLHLSEAAAAKLSQPGSSDAAVTPTESSPNSSDTAVATATKSSPNSSDTAVATKSSPNSSDTAAVTTFDHAAFSCTDLAEFESRLNQQAIQYRVARVPQTGQVQIFLRDPAGNGVELNFANG